MSSRHPLAHQAHPSHFFSPSLPACLSIPYLPASDSACANLSYFLRLAPRPCFAVSLFPPSLLSTPILFMCVSLLFLPSHSRSSPSPLKRRKSAVVVVVERKKERRRGQLN